VAAFVGIRMWIEQVNPRRGLKLRRLFERINWSPPG
jgi:hypothetical protein